MPPATTRSQQLRLYHPIVLLINVTDVDTYFGLFIRYLLYFYIA